MKSVASSALCLGLLMAVAGALLAAVNVATEDRIAANQRSQRQATLKELTGLEIEMPAHRDVVACHEDLVALAIEERGYGGSMDVVVAFRLRQPVGVRVTRHSETPGFSDILAPTAWIGGLGQTDEILDTVSGATITSAAVLRAREAALARFAANTAWCDS